LASGSCLGRRRRLDVPRLLFDNLVGATEDRPRDLSCGGSLARATSLTAAIRMKVLAGAALNRIVEGRKWLARLLELQPDFTVVAFRAYAERFVPEEMLLLYIEGLRKAGLLEE
jgi:hypothetical protein